MNTFDVLTYVLLAIGAVLCGMGVLAFRLPHPLRRIRHRLLIGAWLVAFTVPIVDVALNWTEAVQLAKADLASLRQARAVPTTASSRR